MTVPQFIYLFIFLSIDNWIIVRISAVPSRAAEDILVHFS